MQALRALVTVLLCFRHCTAVNCTVIGLIADLGSHVLAIKLRIT
jgi:hypothetical protein